MITWTINEQTADYILKCLQQRPFVEVHQLLADLVQQSQPKPAEPPKE